MASYLLRRVEALGTLQGCLSFVQASLGVGEVVIGVFLGTNCFGAGFSLLHLGRLKRGLAFAEPSCCFSGRGESARSAHLILVIQSHELIVQILLLLFQSFELGEEALLFLAYFAVVGLPVFPGPRHGAALPLLRNRRELRPHATTSLRIKYLLYLILSLKLLRLQLVLEVCDAGVRHRAPVYPELLHIVRIVDLRSTLIHFF